jgi:hypothetical protein
MVRSAVKLAERWSALTGEPPGDAWQRAFAMKSAGLLPGEGIEPMAYRHLATFNIASMAAAGHSDAAETARCDGALLPCDYNRKTALDALCLGDALAGLLRHRRESNPLRLVHAEFNGTRPHAFLVVHHAADDEERPLSAVVLHYGNPDPPDPSPPIGRVFRLKGAVLAGLVAGD